MKNTDSKQQLCLEKSPQETVLITAKVKKGKGYFDGEINYSKINNE
mgnify:CR=1 FL=1